MQGAMQGARPAAGLRPRPRCWTSPSLQAAKERLEREHTERDQWDWASGAVSDPSAAA